MTSDQIDERSGAANIRRSVTVEGVRLRFAAAHMATLGADLEPLHGHNYQVSARVEGALTDDRWVIDFSALKRIVREACEHLDHRFLLQARSPLLEIRQTSDAWTIRHGERSYRFPAADVAVLPIENTTAELLAQWLWEQATEALTAEGRHSTLTRLAIDVEEMPGQSGGYARDLAGRP
ncbi:MAG: 6-pyruvoyl tetrahydropterin synthase family protein [Chloroflexi bacterium]|nr:MAG: 6-pyruvoyl tetrahydropterin synthase family protein [Chloroflexota bacterium]